MMKNVMLRRATCALSAIAIIASTMAGCKQKNIELSEVDLIAASERLTAIATPEPYTLDMAYGVYGSYSNADMKLSYLGTCDYLPLATEANRIDEDMKALVVGLSIEKLSQKRLKLDDASFTLIDMNTMREHRVEWQIDHDIGEFYEGEKEDVYCLRLVYTVPEETSPEQCLFKIKTLTGDYYYSCAVPDEDIEGTTINYTNMCPLCADEEYEWDTLVVGTCEMCGEKFVSNHSPCQELCFSCSVLHNYCTQCQRYIDKAIIKTK